MINSVKKEENHIKILFTGIESDSNIIAKLGATIAEKPEYATHVITTLPLKRTPKLMIAINSGVKYILTEQWLIDSIKAGKCMEVNSYQSKYIARDKVKESQWGFDMSVTLMKPRGDPDYQRIFNNLSIYVTDGICGKSAPPVEELKAIIESGGGKLLTSLPKEKPNTNMYEKLMIISDSQHLSSLSSSVKKAASKSIGEGIYSIEIIFLSVLRQSLDLLECLILSLKENQEEEEDGDISQKKTRKKSRR